MESILLTLINLFLKNPFQNLRFGCVRFSLAKIDLAERVSEVRKYKRAHSKNDVVAEQVLQLNRVLQNQPSSLTRYTPAKTGYFDSKADPLLNKEIKPSNSCPSKASCVSGYIKDNNSSMLLSFLDNYFGDKNPYEDLLGNRNTMQIGKTTFTEVSPISVGVDRSLSNYPSAPEDSVYRGYEEEFIKRRGQFSRKSTTKFCFLN